MGPQERATDAGTATQPIDLQFGEGALLVRVMAPDELSLEGYTAAGLPPASVTTPQLAEVVVRSPIIRTIDQAT